MCGLSFTPARFAFDTMSSPAACCFIGRLPMCMMESALVKLHCNIHKERQISSNSISGFQRSGSSKLCSTVLCCPNRAPERKKEKKKERKKRWSKPSAKQKRGPPPGRPDPHETSQNDMRSLSLSFSLFFFKPAKTSRPQEGGLKKTRKNRRGPEVRLKGQVARWENPALPLSLSPLPLRSRV